jgi:hypothetical protein
VTLLTAPGAPGHDKPSEKRKVDSSILSLTTIWKAVLQPSHLRKAQKERDSHGAVSARSGQDPHKKPTPIPCRSNPARRYWFSARTRWPFSLRDGNWARSHAG